ncbi:MAG: hypothetical protein ACRD9W_02900 [Terriglobia bacterium]
MQIVMSWLGILRRVGQKAGPYLVLEMLLPGGTLLALLLFLYRRRKAGIGGGAQRAVVAAMRTLASVAEQRILVPVPIRLTVPVSKTASAERL